MGNREVRETVSDWLIVLGAILLFISLFLTWSHQFSPMFLATFGATNVLHDVPRDPTAWQVYSVADVLLALLAAALFGMALISGWRARIGGILGSALALGFTLHALSKPPTNGANIFNPALSVPRYMPTGAAAGAGETVAIIGLVMALAGLTLSLTAE